MHPHEVDAAGRARQENGRIRAEQAGKLSQRPEDEFRLLAEDAPVVSVDLRQGAVGGTAGILEEVDPLPAGPQARNPTHSRHAHVLHRLSAGTYSFRDLSGVTSTTPRSIGLFLMSTLGPWKPLFRRES